LVKGKLQSLKKIADGELTFIENDIDSDEDLSEKTIEKDMNQDYL
jgi:hypothetical protein